MPCDSDTLSETERTRKISEVLHRYQAEITKWQSEWNQLDIVRNEELTPIADTPPTGGLSWIVVADNPSDKEKEDKVYLSPNGEAGALARLILGLAAPGYPRRVAILNKCPIFSSQTEGLEETLKDQPRLMRDMQLAAANAVYHLHQLSPGAYVWIMGHGRTYKTEGRPGFYVTNCDRSERPLFPFFFNQIRRLYLADPVLQPKLFITPHVSGGGKGPSPFLQRIQVRILTDEHKPLQEVMGVFEYTQHLFGEPKKCRRPVSLPGKSVRKHEKQHK